MSSSLFKIEEHVIPAQHIREYPDAIHPSHPQSTRLQLAIKQYTPINPSPPDSTPITIISAHALSFPKELYEPLFTSILLQSRTHGFTIRCFWIADSVAEGQSYVQNEEVIGDDYSWFDHSRDLLHMINNFREEMLRPIIGMAHSRGACEIVNLSLMHPRLLSSLILIEPMIQDSSPPGPHSALFSTLRPDLWPSREAAEKAFRSSIAFKRWHPEVLDLYIKYGLRNVPTALYPEISEKVPATAATLTTTKHQEAWSYVRPNFSPQSSDVAEEHLFSPNTDPGAEGKLLSARPEALITLRNLPYVRPSVCYIFGAKSPMSPPALQEQKMCTTGTGLGGSGGAALGKVEKVVLPSAGHFAPFDDVEGCAKASAEWLGQWLKEWLKEEQWLKEKGSGRSEGGEMRKVSKEWKAMVRKGPDTLRPVAKGKL